MNDTKNQLMVGCIVIGLVALAMVAMGVVYLFNMSLDVFGVDLVMNIIIGFVSLPVFIGAYFLLGWVQHKHSQHALERRDLELRVQLVAPDPNGLLPVDGRYLLSASGSDAAIKSHMAFHWSNRNEPATVPHSLSYSPRIQVKQDGSLLPGADVAGLLQSVSVDSLSELWRTNRLPRDGFLMGYNLDDNEPVDANWRHLYSALIGGMSGTGKSTLIRSILAQSAMQGGKFIVLDPHYDSGDESLGASLYPLGNRLLFDVAHDDKGMTDALFYVDSVGARRLAGRDQDRSPMILVVDETTALLQRSNIAPLLAMVLGKISQETRKVGVYAMCIGQSFNGSVMDTTVRNSFVSMIAMRSRRDVARVQSGNAEFGKAAEKLQIGQCVWLPPSGEMKRLAVPNCTQQDLEAICTSLNGKNVWHTGSTSILPAPPMGSTSAPLPGSTSAPLPGSTSTRIGKCSGSTLEVPAEVLPDSATAARVRQMMEDGCSQNAILRDIWGATGGRRYQKALTEYREIVSQIAGEDN